jgi:hypothetical protein
VRDSLYPRKGWPHRDVEDWRVDPLSWSGKLDP